MAIDGNYPFTVDGYVMLAEVVLCIVTFIPAHYADDPVVTQTYVFVIAACYLLLNLAIYVCRLCQCVIEASLHERRWMALKIFRRVLFAALFLIGGICGAKTANSHHHKYGHAKHGHTNLFKYTWISTSVFCFLTFLLILGYVVYIWKQHIKWRKEEMKSLEQEAVVEKQRQLERLEERLQEERAKRFKYSPESFERSQGHIKHNENTPLLE